MGEQLIDHSLIFHDGAPVYGLFNIEVAAGSVRAVQKRVRASFSSFELLLGLSELCLGLLEFLTNFSVDAIDGEVTEFGLGVTFLSLSGVFELL